jgi:hypothetical protein
MSKMRHNYDLSPTRLQADSDLASLQFTTLFFVHSNLWKNLKRQFTTLFCQAGNSYLERQQVMSIPVHNYIFLQQLMRPR